MRSLFPKLLALALVALVAAPALAQRPGGGRFLQEGGPALLGNKSVQDELKLTDSQKTAIKKIMDERREAVRKARENMDQDAAREAREKSNKELTRIIKDDLKPEQTRRFRQIQLQVAGPRALGLPGVQKVLKMSEKQTTEVKDSLQRLQSEVRALLRDARGDRAKMREALQKVQELRKTAGEKLQKLLTPEQQKKLEQIKGPKFEIKFERRRRPE